MKQRPEFMNLSVNNIELDRNNPRIARWMEMYGDKITAEQMALALGGGVTKSGETGGTSFISLRDSIKTNGGIIHPIIVNKINEDKYIVIEGNTRVLIYREFLTNKIKGNWLQIPAMVYDSLDDDTIHAIRLQAHLVGPREWDPYSKAKYLHYLSTSENLTLAQIVDYCGGNKKEVDNYIAAYIDMENHYRNLLDSDQDFDPSRFSGFVELQRNTLLNSLYNNGFSKDDFASWIIKDKIGPLQNLRSLPKVLNNPKSRETFLHEDMVEALKVLIIPTEIVNLADASLEQLANELSRRIARIEYNYIKKLRSDSASDERAILEEAKENLISLCEDINIEEL